MIFILLAGGCTSLPPAEQESLRLASAQYARGDARNAITRLDKIIREYPGAVEIAEAYYVRGLCRATTGQTPTARQDFEQAVRTSRREDLTANARASLAAIAYTQGEWSTAARLYGECLPAMPDQPPKDQILYHAGVAMQRAGQWDQARQQFGRILFKFRDRPVARAAARQAAWKNDYFSIQVGAYSSTGQADQAIERLRARGMDTFQEFASRDGKALWLILSGRYRTYADAVQALDRIRRTQPDAIIVP